MNPYRMGSVGYSQLILIYIESYNYVFSYTSRLMLLALLQWFFIDQKNGMISHRICILFCQQQQTRGKSTHDDVYAGDNLCWRMVHFPVRPSAAKVRESRP